MKRLRQTDIDIIRNTPITREVFEMDKFEDVQLETCIMSSGEKFDSYLIYLEALRLAFVETNDKAYLNALVTMLPNTYLPVNLKSVPKYVVNAAENWNKKNKEHLRLYTREYYQRNKKVLNERRAEYYKEHPDEVREHNREYYLRNKAKKNEYSRNYYLEHRDEILAKAKAKRK